MLKHTFCHLKGVGRSAEEKLWSHGIMTWDDYMRCKGAGMFSMRKNEDVLEQLQESKGALERGDSGFFLPRLPVTDRVRVFTDFRDRIGYLDIETTGLSSSDEITTIAFYDGRQVRTYVNGQDLTQFPRDVSSCGLLVTFNGDRFDLPFLRLAFGERFDMPHLDLMPVLKAYGCHGGLKACERILGIRRQVPAEIDGREAVRLWNRYMKEEDEFALSLLLAYNAQDVLSLELLLIEAYNIQVRSLPWAFARAPRARQPRIWKRT